MSKKAAEAAGAHGHAGRYALAQPMVAPLPQSLQIAEQQNQAFVSKSLKEQIHHNEILRVALQQWLSAIDTKDIEPREHLDEMRNKNFITADEKEVIDKVMNQAGRINGFLDLLSRRDKDFFDAFLEHLDSLNQKSIADELRRCYDAAQKSRDRISSCVSGVPILFQYPTDFIKQERVDYFVLREHYAAQIKDAFREMMTKRTSPQPSLMPLVLLDGSSGIGKTQIFLQLLAASFLHSMFPDGVIFCHVGSMGVGQKQHRVLTVGQMMCHEVALLFANLATALSTNRIGPTSRDASRGGGRRPTGWNGDNHFEMTASEETIDSVPLDQLTQRCRKLLGGRRCLLMLDNYSSEILVDSRYLIDYFMQLDVPILCNTNEGDSLIRKLATLKSYDVRNIKASGFSMNDVTTFLEKFSTAHGLDVQFDSKKVFALSAGHPLALRNIVTEFVHGDYIVFSRLITETALSFIESNRIFELQMLAYMSIMTFGEQSFLVLPRTRIQLLSDVATRHRVLTAADRLLRHNFIMSYKCISPDDETDHFIPTSGYSSEEWLLSARIHERVRDQFLGRASIYFNSSNVLSHEQRTVIYGALDTTRQAIFDLKLSTVTVTYLMPFLLMIPGMRNSALPLYLPQHLLAPHILATEHMFSASTRTLDHMVTFSTVAFAASFALAYFAFPWILSRSYVGQIVSTVACFAFGTAWCIFVVARAKIFRRARPDVRANSGYRASALVTGYWATNVWLMLVCSRTIAFSSHSLHVTATDFTYLAFSVALLCLLDIPCALASVFAFVDGMHLGPKKGVSPTSDAASNPASTIELARSMPKGAIDASALRGARLWVGAMLVQTILLVGVVSANQDTLNPIVVCVFIYFEAACVLLAVLYRMCSTCCRGTSRKTRFCMALILLAVYFLVFCAIVFVLALCPAVVLREFDLNDMRCYGGNSTSHINATSVHSTTTYRPTWSW